MLKGFGPASGGVLKGLALSVEMCSEVWPCLWRCAQLFGPVSEGVLRGSVLSLEVCSKVWPCLWRAQW